MSYEDRIDELENQAWDLEDGPAKLALYEEAVRIADAHQDTERGFELRHQVVHVGTYGGFAERAIVAFSWQLAQCDRDPERFSESSLMWRYKWIVSSVLVFPEIPLEKIHEMLRDMEARYRRVGLNLRPIHKERCRLARATGYREEAREQYKLWMETPRDFGSDCTACDRDFRMDHLIYLGRLKQALKLGEPILQGRERCASIPHGTYASVLIPLLKLDRCEEAESYHRTGYPMVSRNRNYLWEVSEHMRFKAIMGDRSGAVRLFERHLPWALETRERSPELHFYLCGLFLMRELAERRRKDLKLRLPSDFPLCREEGSYSVVELETWLEQSCTELARRFDQRNGTSVHASRMEQLEELKELRRSK